MEFANAPTNDNSIGCNSVRYQMRKQSDGAALGAVQVGFYKDPLCPQPSPDLIAAEAELLPEGEFLMLGIPPSPPPSSPISPSPPEDNSNACCSGEMCITTEQAALIPSADCDDCDSCMRTVVSLTDPQPTMEYACNHLYDRNKEKPCLFSPERLKPNGSVKREASCDPGKPKQCPALPPALPLTLPLRPHLPRLLPLPLPP